MTVREYIGARYVPLYMGDWDNSNTYEPLSVVNYQGDSYTSRQFVPKNVAITNTDYWIQSANYSSQVEAYREEVLAFDGRIDALEEAQVTYPLSVANGGTGAATARDARANLNFGTYNQNAAITNATGTGQSFAIAANVDNPNNDLDGKRVVLYPDNEGLMYRNSTDSQQIWKLKPISENDIHRKNCILIGDSYLRDTSSAGGQTGWGNKFLEYTGFNQIARYKSGGAGWLNPGVNDTESGLNFLGMAQKAVSQLSLAIRRTVDYVVISGGINDVKYGGSGYDQDAIAQAIQNTTTYVRTNFPNAKIIVSLATCSLRWEMDSKMRYLNRYIAAWAMNGVLFAVDSNAWFINRESAMGQEDGLHPNDTGYDFMARKLANLAMGSSDIPALTYFNTSKLHDLIVAQIPTFDDWATLGEWSKIAIWNHQYIIDIIVNITDKDSVPAGNNQVWLPVCTYMPNGHLANAMAGIGSKWYYRPNAAAASSTDHQTSLGTGNVYVLLTPNFYDPVTNTDLVLTNSTHIWIPFTVPMD